MLLANQLRMELLSRLAIERSPRFLDLVADTSNTVLKLDGFLGVVINVEKLPKRKVRLDILDHVVVEFFAPVLEPSFVDRLMFTQAETPSLKRVLPDQGIALFILQGK